MKDIRKLVAGSADNKLLVGPYYVDSKNADLAFEHTLVKLKEILDLVTPRPEENWLVAIVPHPGHRRSGDEEKVSC